MSWVLLTENVIFDEKPRSDGKRINCKRPKKRFQLIFFSLLNAAVGRVFVRKSSEKPPNNNNNNMGFGIRCRCPWLLRIQKLK